MLFVMIPTPILAADKLLFHVRKADQAEPIVGCMAAAEGIEGTLGGLSGFGFPVEG